MTISLLPTQIVDLLPSEIIEVSTLDVQLTNEEILADLLYPEPPARAVGDC